MAMAKEAYEEMLSRFIDQQRAQPNSAAQMSLANRTSADFYDYLYRKGGSFDFHKKDRDALVDRSWDELRIKFAGHRGC